MLLTRQSKISLPSFSTKGVWTDYVQRQTQVPFGSVQMEWMLNHRWTTYMEQKMVLDACLENEWAGMVHDAITLLQKDLVRDMWPTLGNFLLEHKWDEETIELLVTHPLCTSDQIRCILDACNQMGDGAMVDHIFNFIGTDDLGSYTPSSEVEESWSS